MATTRPGRTCHLAMLAGAQAAGQAGTWAGYVAALPVALTWQRPAVAVGLIAAAWSAPSAAARAVGGITDRYGPHRTGAMAWGLAAVAAVVPVVTRPGLRALMMVLAVLALGGTWGVAAGETAPTWLPSLANPADAGPSLAIATNLALMTGPLIASGLLSYAGDRAAWALTATLSVAAALGTLLIPARRPGRTPARKQRRVLPPAARWVLAITAGVYLVMGTITILEPLYVRRVLASPLTIYGSLLAVVGTAGILTSLAAWRWPHLTHGRWAIPAAALTLAAGTALYVNTPVVGWAFTGAAVFGSGAALFRLSARAIIVQVVPASAHGRVFSWWETVQCGASVLPAVFLGPLVALLGLRTLLNGCGALATATATASLWSASGNHAHQATLQQFSPPTGGPLSQPHWPTRAPLDLDPARYRLPRPARPAADYAAEGVRPRDADLPAGFCPA